MKQKTLAVDFGGTNIRAAIVDRRGTIVNRHSAPTLANEGRDAVLGRVIETIEEVSESEDMESLAGIGISQPGPTEPETGVLYAAPNLPGWGGFALTAVLTERFSLAANAANDANAAAIGVHRFGNGRGSTNMIYMTVSTGIGGGIIIDGRLYVGSRGFAGEIGHIQIDADGPRCACGNTGCLEALSSGTAVARIARESLAAGEKSALIDLSGGDPNNVTAEMVAETARSGDLLGQRIFAEASRNLGIGIVGLIHAFDPDLIVLGGGLTQQFDLLLRGVTKEVKRRVLGKDQDKIPVIKSDLGDDAGLLGAAALAFEAADATDEA